MNIPSITGPQGCTLTAAALLLACGSGCHMAAQGQNLAGVRAYEQGQYPAAMQNFQQALAQDPVNADAVYNMAATFHKTGVSQGDENSVKQAEALYNQCLDIDANHVDCRRALAVLLVETDRSDKAFNMMKNWAQEQPASADARIELARLYDEFGDKETSQLYLGEALKIDAHNSRALAAMGRLREEAGDYTQALANYQRSYANGFQPEVAERIAALNQTLGNSRPLTSGGTRIVTTPDAGGTQRY